MTYPARRNLDVLRDATPDTLTRDQRDALVHHLLGGVAAYVPPREWDRAIARAVRFATTKVKS